MFYGNDEIGSTGGPLFFVIDILKPASQAVVVSLLLIVGFVFANLRSLLPHKLGVSWFTVISVIFTRLVLIPGICAGTLILLHFAAILPADPSLVFVAMLQTICPTNIDILIISQLNQHAVEETAVIIFWMYLCSIGTLLMWTTLFAYIVAIPV